MPHLPPQDIENNGVGPGESMLRNRCVLKAGVWHLQTLPPKQAHICGRSIAHLEGGAA